MAISLFAQDNEKLFLQKSKTDLITALQNGRSEFWIVFNEQADVSGAKQLKTKEEKGQFVFDKLTRLASRTQIPFIALLNRKGVKYQPFWIANSIFIEGDINLAKELASYPEVKELLPNPKLHVQKPVNLSSDEAVRMDSFGARQDASSVATIEWNISKVNAPQVWAMGYKGQGAVVGGHDTGYEWDHLAIQDQYRGWNGVIADHNFNWHDAIHTGSGGPCGLDSKFPCDDLNHGTHTMGTMVGDDGSGNQIGTAPMAKWIGARNMDQGTGTLTTYIECFQWFLAPTDLNNQNPMPSKAPDVINNSWGCDAAEGCNTSNFTTMETAVNNLRAAGIVIIGTGDNDGPACNTITTPPTFYVGTFAVGSTSNSDAVLNSSGRGNISVDGSGRIKPDICAPGANVRSCIPGGGYTTMSGTSMAGPNVAGAVALLISAVPSLRGQVDTIESILEKTAIRITSTQTCNGTSPSTYPNNTVGYGRIDILAAVKYALATSTSDNRQSLTKGVTIFPMPVKDKFFVLFNYEPDKAVEVTLLNTTGQVILEKTTTLHNSSLEIPVDELSKGFYLYSIKTAHKTYYGKFIKE